METEIKDFERRLREEARVNRFEEAEQEAAEELSEQEKVAARGLGMTFRDYLRGKDGVKEDEKATISLQGKINERISEAAKRIGVGEPLPTVPAEKKKQEFINQIVEKKDNE